FPHVRGNRRRHRRPRASDGILARHAIRSRTRAHGTGAPGGASRRLAGAASADSANHPVVERSRSARQHRRENGPFPVFMKIIVCVGTGGVGKTSVAASIALTEARAGAKCLVLTTDPS